MRSVADGRIPDIMLINITDEENHGEEDDTVTTSNKMAIADMAKLFD